MTPTEAAGYALLAFPILLVGALFARALMDRVKG